jgi:hypothetical protein
MAGCESSLGILLPHPFWPPSSPLHQGIEYLFVSNSDNLGATLDTTLLQYFATSGKAFLMEVGVAGP